MSIRFTTDDFLRRSSAPSDPWTMCGWVYRSVDTNDYAWLFGCNLQAGGGTHYVGAMFYSGGDVLTLVAGSSTGSEDNQSVMTPTHPGWFFVCLQSNGLAPKCWGADEVDTSLSSATGSISGGTPVPDQIEVGDDEVYGPGEDLNGRIVGLKCWDALLTETEIWAERFSLRPVRLANLWGSWPMLHHTDIADYSGYGRDLSVGGGTFATEENPPVPWGTTESGLIIPQFAIILEQEGYRFRDDDAGEAAAAWLATQDNNITRAKNVNTRLRMLINATGNPAAAQFQLEYRKVGAASWNKLDVAP